ncbi:MAG TPA: aminoglycoside phosphotransferase family protein [Mycobacteriales bacterium]|nr:aminoglycoside phosphotransferase family protein [Mycobacteriales bacterium]
MEAPPADVLAWVESSLGSGVSDVARMAGGIDAHTFRLALADGSTVVLRMTEPGHHEDIEYLAQVLDLLAPTPVPAPCRLVHAAALGDGRVPVMVQSLLEGDPTIPAEPDDAWLSAHVTTILRMQELPVAPWMHDRAAVRWEDLPDVSVEELGAGDRLLLDLLRERGPAAPLTPVFGHDDFWVGNTLRDGDRVVGVVDWGHAGVVSAARDVTYCAVDSSLCYGLDVGDRLLDSFARRRSVDAEELLVWTARSVLSSRYFPEWLAGWNGLGVPVRHEEAAGRRTELLERTLARLG